MATTPTNGPDIILGGTNNDVFFGMGGDDFLSGTHFDNHAGLPGGIPGAAIPSLASYDTSQDILYGDSGNDTIYGAGGRDTIQGGYGNDLIVGGAGPDYLIGDDGSNFGPAMNPTAGAAGRDVFKLQHWADSDFNNGGPDVIADFWPGVDKIDVSWLERQNAPGFRWNGPGGFSGGPTLEAGYGFTPDGNTQINIYLASTRAGAYPPAYDPVYGPKGPPFGVPTGSIVLLGQHVLTKDDFIWHEGGPPLSLPGPKLFVDEYQAQTVRLYDTVFDRPAEPEGRAFWHNVLASGYTLDTVADLFMTAPEFQARYGNPDHGTFVSTLYQNVLNRAGEQSGVDYWSGHLNSGVLDRSDVVVFFSESEEHKQIVTPQDYLL